MSAVSGRCYLYGGRGEMIHNTITELDLDTLKWKAIETGGEVPDSGRFGHSCTTYRKGLYLFGGVKQYN